MGKYDRLAEHLVGADAPRVTLTFAEIERILGEALPASASVYRAWWSNETAGKHVQARAWGDAGYRVVSVDQAQRRVVFERQ